MGVILQSSSLEDSEPDASSAKASWEEVAHRTFGHTDYQMSGYGKARTLVWCSEHCLEDEERRQFIAAEAARLGWWPLFFKKASQLAKWLEQGAGDHEEYALVMGWRETQPTFLLLSSRSLRPPLMSVVTCVTRRQLTRAASFVQTLSVDLQRGIHICDNGDIPGHLLGGMIRRCFGAPERSTRHGRRSQRAATASVAFSDPAYPIASSVRSDPRLPLQRGMSQALEDTSPHEEGMGEWPIRTLSALQQAPPKAPNPSHLLSTPPGLVPGSAFRGAPMQPTWEDLRLPLGNTLTPLEPDIASVLTAVLQEPFHIEQRLSL